MQRFRAPDHVADVAEQAGSAGEVLGGFARGGTRQLSQKQRRRGLGVRRRDHFVVTDVAEKPPGVTRTSAKRLRSSQLRSNQELSIGSACQPGQCLCCESLALLSASKSYEEVHCFKPVDDSVDVVTLLVGARQRECVWVRFNHLALCEGQLQARGLGSKNQLRGRADRACNAIEG